MRESLRQQILTISERPLDSAPFEQLAVAVFQYQATYNPIYRDYLQHLGVQSDAVTELRRIPFMPIGFFKKHSVLTGLTADAEFQKNTLTFASSGTTGEQTSRHFVPDSALYDAISTHIFEQTYGPLSNFHILALLPSYLERNNSSLVYMVQRFMDQTASGKSGFFLHNHDELTEQLRQLTQQPDQKKILLIGVTFGLLDWAESGTDLSFLAQNPNLVVMETGGMKGRRQELLRQEVHAILTDQLGVQAIHSEYGMTELLSQAYSVGNGVFRPSPTLRVFLRDINDPFLLYPNDYKRAGGINVVDLANLDSCAFIETQDLGQYTEDNGDFQVIGRFDNSDVRGCNLLVL
ncbi:acyltransferase [Spirosoma agri]